MVEREAQVPGSHSVFPHDVADVEVAWMDG